MISINYLFEETKLPPSRPVGGNKTISERLVTAIKEVIGSIKTGKELSDMLDVTKSRK